MSAAEKPAENLGARKRAIRERVRAVRANLDASVAVEAAERLAERLLALPELSSVHLVLAYGSSAEEIDLWPAAVALRERGTKIAYPRIDVERTLALHVLDTDTELIAGPFGIREPSPEAPLVGPEYVDVVLVPGVAFDEVGHRLGYGGGYYDRLLPLLVNAVRVGVSFDEQVVGPLPAQPHDERVDILVTPTRTLRMVEADNAEDRD